MHPLLVAPSFSSSPCHPLSPPSLISPPRRSPPMPPSYARHSLSSFHSSRRRRRRRVVVVIVAPVDLACAALGARLVHASNERFGAAHAVCSGLQPTGMHDGFEVRFVPARALPLCLFPFPRVPTLRRRGHDVCVFCFLRAEYWVSFQPLCHGMPLYLTLAMPSTRV